MEQFQIASDIISLSDTIMEGLEHIKKRVFDGYFEETYYLLEDIIDAIASIHKATEPMLPLMGENRIEQYAEHLNHLIDEMTNNYQTQRIEKAKTDMQLVLIPAFKEWKNELERCLSDYVAS
ncbi:hypothetical protein [Syntrophomonas curvata]